MENVRVGGRHETLRRILIILFILLAAVLYNLGSPVKNELFKVNYYARIYAPFALAAGVLCYILLSLPKPSKNVVYLSGIKQFLQDFGMWLFVAFACVILSINYIDVTVAADVRFFAIFIVFACILIAPFVYMSLKYAKFRIVPENNGFTVFHIRGREVIKFEDIESMAPATLKPPEWLFWVTLFSNASTASAVGTDKSSGIYLRMKTGKCFTIWLRDRNGKFIYKNSQGFMDILDKAPVVKKDELYTIRALNPPFERKYPKSDVPVQPR